MSNVTRQTVINWIKTGKLRAKQTPGGHRRVLREDLEHFFWRNQMDPDVILDFEEQSRKKVPYCWEYFAKGFARQSSSHECKACAVKKARAQRCYVLSDMLRKMGDFCHTECNNCGFFKRYGDILNESGA